MLPECSVEDLEYFKKVCVGLLENSEEISPPLGILCCTEEFTVSEEKIVETDFMTANQAFILEKHRLITDENLIGDCTKFGKEPFSKDFLMGSLIIMFEQGFTPHRISGAYSKEGKYFVNYKGFCGLHGYCHHSNNFSWQWDPKFRDTSIIKCFHDNKVKKLSFPMNI